MSDLFSCAIAFIVTFACIWLLKPLALRLGLVDSPHGRKQHEGHIPLIGGIAILLGFLSALLALPLSLANYRSFAAGCVLLVFVGILDDFHELSARSRLIAQIIAALFMTAWGGVILSDLGNLIFIKDIVLNNWALPITVIGVVGIINAVNMTDGVDGLAGTLTLVEMCFLAYLAMHAQNFLAFHILIIMMASIAAFLCFNLRILGRQNALIFMGDAGSMLLGFVLAWFLVELSQGINHAATPVTMLWIMAVPLLDIGGVMFRRLQKRRSLFSPDREHMHHLLQEFNFSSSQIVMIMGGLSLIFGLIGIIANYQGIAEGYMFVGFIVLFIVYYSLLIYLRKMLPNNEK